MSGGYHGPGRRGDDTGRREDDTVVAMLKEQADRTAKSLEDHVKDCSQMQRRVLLVVSALLIWVISHSPEAARLAAKAFPSFGG